MQFQDHVKINSEFLLPRISFTACMPCVRDGSFFAQTEGSFFLITTFVCLQNTLVSFLFPCLLPHQLPFIPVLCTLFFSTFLLLPSSLNLFPRISFHEISFRDTTFSRSRTRTQRNIYAGLHPLTKNHRQSSCSNHCRHRCTIS